MDLLLKDKVAMVTGGASGIGEAVTRAFAAEGAVAVIAGRKPAQAAPILEGLRARGLRAGFVQVELTDEDQVRAAVAETVGAWGRIDILVNNAGFNDGAGLENGTADFRLSLERNLVQVFAITHHALPYLKASRGTIVNIGSKVADTGQGGTSGYAASKGGMNALTREWALELAPSGVRVNAVIPSETWTPLYGAWLERTTPDPVAALERIGRHIPLGRRLTTSEEIAATVVFLASGRSSHTTGQIVVVDGGYLHLDRMCTAD